MSPSQGKYCLPVADDASFRPQKIGVVGAVAGPLERTAMTSAARRVVVSNSSDAAHHLFTPSPPLLADDNRGCQFAP